MLRLPMRGKHLHSKDTSNRDQAGRLPRSVFEHLRSRSERRLPRRSLKGEGGIMLPSATARHAILSQNFGQVCKRPKQRDCKSRPFGVRRFESVPCPPAFARAASEGRRAVARRAKAGRASVSYGSASHADMADWFNTRRLRSRSVRRLRDRASNPR
jgi:hypothetical protein